MVSMSVLRTTPDSCSALRLCVSAHDLTNRCIDRWQIFQFSTCVNAEVNYMTVADCCRPVHAPLLCTGKRGGFIIATIIGTCASICLEDTSVQRKLNLRPRLSTVGAVGAVALLKNLCGKAQQNAVLALLSGAGNGAKTGLLHNLSSQLCIRSHLFRQPRRSVCSMSSVSAAVPADSDR